MVRGVRVILFDNSVFGVVCRFVLRERGRVVVEVYIEVGFFFIEVLSCLFLGFGFFLRICIKGELDVFEVFFKF